MVATSETESLRSWSAGGGGGDISIELFCAAITLLEFFFSWRWKGLG